MTRRPFGLTSLTLLVLALAAFGAAGLGWVTVSALRVEEDQRTAAAAAERSEKERLALWKLDGRIAPALGLEGFRQYEHFTGLYAPPGDGPGGPQYLSPLISIELPDWIPLHFQFDPAVGWMSPQVLPESVVSRLANPVNDLDLSNLTDERRERLASLNRRFPIARTAASFKPLDADTSDASAVVVALVPSRTVEVPTPLTEATPVAPPGVGLTAGLLPPKSQWFGANVRGGQATPPPYAGNSAMNQMTQQGTARSPADKNVTDDSLNRGRFGEKVARDLAGGLGNSQVVNDPSELAPHFVGPPTPDGLKKSAEKSSPERPESSLATPPAPISPTTPMSSTGGFGGGSTASRGAGLPSGGAGGPPPVTRGANPKAPAKTLRGTTVGPDDPSTADLAKRAESKDRKETPPPAGLAALAEPPKVTEGPAVAKAAVAAKEDDAPLAVKKPAPPAPPVSVHLGAMRPKWLTAADGERILVVVRPARLEGKTVYQGAILDWDKLRDVLKEEVADDFPMADLVPSDSPTDAPQHQLSTLPVRFDSGPPPPLTPAGWTPLRLGLGLAWLAATVALVAVWFGGWSLVDLSERRIRFVSAVTHELRTPLTSLRLYLDMLTSGMVTDETQKAQYLTTLSHESNRLNQLIENVLDFAKLEKRAVAVQKQPVPVADLIDHCRETWAERLAADGKELVAVSTVPSGQSVTADPRIAQQILGNLIDNARKYSPGAADPRVWLWVKPSGRRVAFEVEDRGPGIPAAERTSIFRAFRRGGTSGATGGAGLGLALAKQWAESLGGTLTCRPADGETGACFRLELPA
jgi:signal transduction histidine kinase